MAEKCAEDDKPTMINAEITSPSWTIDSEPTHDPPLVSPNQSAATISTNYQRMAKLPAETMPLEKESCFYLRIQASHVGEKCLH
jgi:hypothetical protein